MTPAEFRAKWQASTRNERAACQEHFVDLCRLLEEPTPNSDPTGGVRKADLRRYLDEFVYRWNRRGHVVAAFDTLLGLAMELQHASYRDFAPSRFDGLRGASRELTREAKR
jgi:hypothetical protein